MTTATPGPRKSICVDLDGVLADYSKGWQGIDHIGDPLPGAVDFVNELNKLGRIIIFTCRCSEQHRERDCVAACGHITAWLDKHDFKYDEVYTGRGKPIASAYIDDRAVYCDPGRAPKGKGGFFWGITLATTKLLIERTDGFVSGTGITV